MNTKHKIQLFCGIGALLVFIFVGMIVYHVIRNSNDGGLCDNPKELFYEDPTTKEGTCLKANSQGPCGNNMVLVPDALADIRGYGICECDVGHYERPMIHHEETNQCYFIFTKAHCKDGEWLTVLRSKGPTCVPRECDEPEDGLIELVPLKDGRCVELGKSDVTCSKSEVIRFFRKKIYPNCMVLSIGSIGVPKYDGCRKGYYSTKTGKCQPDFDFD